MFVSAIYTGNSVRPAGGAREVVDLIDCRQTRLLSEVGLDYPEPAVCLQADDVSTGAAAEVVHADDLKPAGNYLPF